VTRRGKLTDEAWARIAPLLPENGRRGKQWKEHREVVNGILWRIRTGALWRDLPSRYGPWQTCYDRFARWSRDGTWDRLLAHVQMNSDAAGEVMWEVSVDSTISRAHQHAAGHVVPRAEKTQKGDLPPAGRGARAEPGRADDQAAFGLRRARATAIGGRDSGPAPREHPTRSGARHHQGGAPEGLRRAATQTTRASYRRPRLQLPEVPEAAAAARHPAHHPRAA
jgi:transposase